MAALVGNEVDNALIEINGPEVPILDGSAAPFVDADCKSRREKAGCAKDLVHAAA